MQSRDSGSRRNSLVRSLGLGLITGAADDDCSAIGTYVQAGAQIGYNILWVSPLLFPMMFTVVYLSGKLGQVSGQGLFGVLCDHYPRWVLYVILAGVIIGNTIEAAADIGGIAAAIAILVPVPHWLLVLGVSLLTLALQLWGSYRIISNVFRVLALTLVSYVVSALLAHPDIHAALRGTVLPHIKFDRTTLALLVAMMGASLSAYIYTWQSNEEVEEKQAAGKQTLEQRRGTTRVALNSSFWDVLIGMFFSSVVMYFVLLSASATLFSAGHHTIDTAADAAQALRPLAGRAAALLFTGGIVGVGFLAIPVMTTGAAYDLTQTFGWRNGLHLKLRQAPAFYAAIAFFTFAAMAMNFIGINPMRALVIAGMVQGFSTPPLLYLIMRMTNNRRIMGNRTNSLPMNILGWITTAAVSACSTWLLIASVRSR